MKEEKNIKDKINKFKLKHPVCLNTVKHIFRIILIMLVLYLLFMFSGEQIKKMISNSQIVVILASILGASVGGIISYFINIQSMLKSNHMKSSIINKKVIYEPLLMEFKKIRKELSENEMVYFCFNSNYRTIGSISYEVWGRIKSDTRYYQMPDYLRKECIIVDNNIQDYSKAKISMVDNAYEIFNKLIEQKGYKIVENINGIKSFIKAQDLIRGVNVVKDCLLKEGIKGIPEVSNEDKEKIIYEFDNLMKSSSIISDYVNIKNTLLESLDECIETIEIIIIRIANVYERKNNVF